MVIIFSIFLKSLPGVSPVPWGQKLLVGDGDFLSTESAQWQHRAHSMALADSAECCGYMRDWSCSNAAHAHFGFKLVVDLLDRWRPSPCELGPSPCVAAIGHPVLFATPCGPRSERSLRSLLRQVHAPCASDNVQACWIANF